MTDVLYRWPEAARFGKIIPKTKFYERAVVTPTVRARFVAEVEGITWAYKLAESTIRLRSSSEECSRATYCCSWRLVPGLGSVTWRTW